VETYARAALRLVLLIDDDPGDVEIVRMAVDPRAWTLIHAAGLAEALAVLSENRIDVVLLDLGLPGAGGVEAVHRVGREFADIPVVVLTGVDDEAVSLQAVQAGAQDCLVKGRLNERALAHALTCAIERHRAETALAYLAAIVESSTEAVLRCSLEGVIASWNRGAERIFGQPASAAVGSAFADLIAEELRPTARAIFDQLRRGEGSPTFEARWTFEARCVRKDRRHLHVAFTLSAIRDRASRVVGASVVAWDVTRQKELEAEVLALSLRDELTGLHNRRGFIQLAEQQMKLAKRQGHGMILLYVDLDRLKAINDSFGHAAGDEALSVTATLLRETFRESSVIGRLGGDEFVVLIVDAAPASAHRLVARLQGNVARSNAGTQRRYALSMSVGVAIADPRHPTSLETLWSRADAAMYRAKPAAALPPAVPV
jgi:two-component system cell cycle response regulator